jgi:hypothetical protein
MVKYIQDEKGRVEAAVVPIELWELIKKHFHDARLRKGRNEAATTDFEQMMAGLDIDVEEDFKKINDFWK